jgi:hypothetical protein
VGDIFTNQNPEEEVQRFEQIVNDLDQIGKWVSLMSAGVMILYPHNTGYAGRLVEPRYYPHKVKKTVNFPRGFGPRVPGFETQDAIKKSIEHIHISRIDSFYQGLLTLVTRADENMMNQELAQGLAMTSQPVDVVLEELVAKAKAKADSKMVKVGICVVQKMSPVLRGNLPGNVSLVVGLTAANSDVKSLALPILVEYLQTTFVENLTRYASGEVRPSPRPATPAPLPPTPNMSIACDVSYYVLCSPTGHDRELCEEDLQVADL